MGKGTRVCDHVLKILDYLNGAEIQGAQIDDNSKINMVLESLPKTFNEFMVNYSMNKRKMTLTELMNELNSAEDIYRVEKSLGSINIAEKGSSSRPKPKGKGDFKEYLVENEIMSQLTTPETPQQNGVAEMRNRTLLDMLLRDRKNKTLALSQAVYIDKILARFSMENSKTVGYTDSDFMSDKDSRKSTSGYVFTLGSGAISWGSVKQSCIADSTTEAEYVAASEAAKEAIWLRKFLQDLEVVPTVTIPFKLFCDNSGAVAQSKELRNHKKQKHIERKYHLRRDIVQRGDVEVTQIAS
ncbi:hypothetical protein KPL70_026615 [Citrus sinensis]|nr:hypothetical protein KPL70_026615 [Citrus sinensis]